MAPEPNAPSVCTAMLPLGATCAYSNGDGAGAALLEATDEPGRGVLSVHLHADGRFAEDLYCEAPGSKYHPRVTAEMIASGRIYPRMEGQKVFKHAVVRWRIFLACYRE